MCRIDIERLKAGEISYERPTPLRPDLVGKPIVWQYWGQGTRAEALPDIVRICFASVDRYKGEHQVIRLSDETIAEYVALPSFVYDKLRNNDSFTRTFFSDLLRLALLTTYGGVWLDATILLTAPLSQKYCKMPFFAFQRSNDEPDKLYWRGSYVYYYGWDKRYKVRLLNSIIFARPNNELLVALYALILNYWKERSAITEYFFFQIYFQEMIEGYWRDYNCPIINDCLPHILQTKINGGAYHRISYQEAAMLCSMHKMTYFSDGVARELVVALDSVGLGDLIQETLEVNKQQDDEDI